jgi:membrane-associated phospholipid phosphatase
VNSFFVAKVFADYYPESPWKPLMWAAAAGIPAFTGIMRVKAGEHFPTDVIAGYTFGALLGFFIPHMHRVRVASEALSLSVQPYRLDQASGLRLVVHIK